MTTARFTFTEAIEDHLALKRENAKLEAALPLASFSTEDPLDRYPGGPVRPAIGSIDFGDGGSVPAGVAARATDAQTAGSDTNVGTPFSGSSTAQQTQTIDAPSAHAVQPAAANSANVVEGTFRLTPEPLSGMVPMLSLVEDVDDVDEPEHYTPPRAAGNAAVALPPVKDDTSSSFMDVVQPERDDVQVVRFPGGAGPRDTQQPATPGIAPGMIATDAGFSATLPSTTDAADETPTGEQPVIVIDVDEPLAPAMHSAPVVHGDERRGSTGKSGLFGRLRRKRKDRNEPDGDGWFSGSPRDFSWDD